MLGANEIIRRANQVWKDVEAGKIKRFKGTKADASISVVELDQLYARGKTGVAATALLLRLRVSHAGRMMRGETFAINCEAMAEANTLPYSAPIIRKARDLLLKLGYIERVKEAVFAGARREPHEYVLIERAPIMTGQHAGMCDDMRK